MLCVSTSAATDSAQFGLGLEEIDSVFETNGVNPVKMSMNIQKIKKQQGQGLYGNSSRTGQVEEVGAPEVKT